MDKNYKFSYRFMKNGEENDVYDLIFEVFHKYVAPTYSQKGIETFLGMLTTDFLMGTSSEKFTAVAEYIGKHVGMLSIINNNHIALLFVKPEFQGLGIGKSLIQFGIDNCLKGNPQLDNISVSSSPNSLSFYQNDGFVKNGEEQNENGMRFIPMQKYINGRPAK